MVLAAVLDAHPEALTFDALAHRLLAPPIDLGASYAVACAVRELVIDGVLESDGLHVTPTQAAICAAGLEVEL